MPTTDKPSDAQAIIDAVKKLHVPSLMDVGRDMDGGPIKVLLAPEGFHLHSVKDLLEDYLAKPERRQGTAALGDLASFIGHANRFKDDDSAIFAKRSEDRPSMTSVLDYHLQGPKNGDARFGKHRGTYSFPTSKSWEVWRAVDGKALSQVQFAEFLEEYILDVDQPPTEAGGEMPGLLKDLTSRLGGEVAGPSRLLTVARGLKVNESSEVTNANTLSSGETELTFRTTHQTMDAAGGTLVVPQLFQVRIPVFDGDAAYLLPIRLRYRKNGGSIVWTMIRYRPDLVFFDAFDRAAERVSKETGLPIFVGTPEA